MSKQGCVGMSLVELLVAMAIAALVGSMVLQMVVSFQTRILCEISRNDLQDRAQRLLRFLASDIGEAAFLIGSEPQRADGSPLSLVHGSLAGDPLETMAFSILATDNSADDDRLMIVKAVSFFPPLHLEQAGLSGETELILNRRPNCSPGSTRELLPAPEAINSLVLANHRVSYAVQLAGQSLQLAQPLSENVPADTEVFGVRVRLYQLEPVAGSKRLRRDDFTSRDILDDAVDGLQFEYLLSDGSVVNQPANPQDIRGVRISMLIRALRPDRNHIDTTVYSLGNRDYGPFRDHYRRCLVSSMVEVKNNAL